MATFSIDARTNPPAADIYISGLPAGTSRIWLYREWLSKSVRVRTDDQAKIIALATRLEDYDVPLGTDVSYRVRAFSATGSELAVSGNSSGTVAFATIDPDTAWLSDPLAPGLGVNLVLDGSSDQQRTYQSGGVVAKVIGSSLPVAITENRLQASSWSFTFRAPDFETAGRLEALLQPGGVLLLRADPTVMQHPTGLLYLMAPQVVRDNIGYSLAYEGEQSEWTLVGDSVRPPTVGVVMPVREYLGVREESSTYFTVRDTNADYLSLLRG
jgi:hypothetical protein